MKKFLIAYFCTGLGFSGQRLESPQRILTIPNVAGSHTSPMRWERGRLVQIDHDTSTVLAFDTQGTMLLHSRVLIDDSLSVRLYNVAVSPAGTYAVEGTAVSTGGVPASFIALIDSQGRTAKVIQLSPAAAFGLRFADDGTLWAAVRVHDDKFREVPEYDMLRQYDASGVLIQTALPRKSFASKKCPIQLPILTTSGSKLGLYADVSMTWVEVSFTGQVLGRWNFPSPGTDSRLIVDRLAVTPTDDIVVSAAISGPNTKRSHGLYIFNRNTETLDPLLSDQTSGSYTPYLIGLDGDVPVTSTTPSQVLWTPMRKTR